MRRGVFIFLVWTGAADADSVDQIFAAAAGLVEYQVASLQRKRWIGGMFSEESPLKTGLLTHKFDLGEAKPLTMMAQ